MSDATNATNATNLSGRKWYKVLVKGESFHGGSFQWSLPTESEPGQWHEIPQNIPLVLCQQGFHLTDLPAAWFRHDADVYAVEFEGEVTAYDQIDRKIAVRKCRLVKKLDAAELATHKIFLEGYHELSGVIAFASGSATVTASGSATVTAYNSATVTASGSATIISWSRFTKVNLEAGSESIWLDRSSEKTVVHRAETDNDPVKPTAA